MRKPMQPVLTKVEDSPLWKEANALAELIYGITGQLPEEEKWTIGYKFKNAATDLIFYTTQALASTSRGGAEQDWSQARKAAYAMRTEYRFSGRQKWTELDPEVMVRIDTFIKQVDHEITKNAKMADDANQYDLDLWREKYKIWSKLHES